MDKKTLEEYLHKLENFESVLSKGGEVDQDFMNEIESTLQSLSNDSLQVANMSQNNTPPPQNNVEVDFSIQCKIK